MQTKHKEKRLKEQFLHVDLSEIMGKAWSEIELTEAGIRFPGWNRPFSPGELRSMFMRLQLLQLLEHENRRLRKERESAWKAQEAAEDRSQYYRRQLRLESSLGLMLQGLSHHL